MQIAAESVLFASGEPVHISRICMALDTDRPRAEEALQRLGDYYAFERRGIRLIRMEDSYQLCSALEVLAIAAYYQPVTRAQVDQIRGVDSAYTMGLLLDRGLIEECGRLSAPGRPRLYRTTQGFLRAFHISSLEELPPLPGMAEGDQISLEDHSEPAEE